VSDQLLIPVTPFFRRRNDNFALADIVRPFADDAFVPDPPAMAVHDILPSLGHEKIGHERGGVRMRWTGRQVNRHQRFYRYERLRKNIIDGRAGFFLPDRFLMMAVNFE